MKLEEARKLWEKTHALFPIRYDAVASQNAYWPNQKIIKRLLDTAPVPEPEDETGRSITLDIMEAATVDQSRGAAAEDLGNFICQLHDIMDSVFAQSDHLGKMGKKAEPVLKVIAEAYQLLGLFATRDAGEAPRVDLATWDRLANLRSEIEQQLLGTEYEIK